MAAAAELGKLIGERVRRSRTECGPARFALTVFAPHAASGGAQ